MMPRMLWKSDNFAKMKKVNTIIGKSVIIGAKATFTPAFMSCRSVSEIIRVKSGPGAKPADKPKTIPISK